MKTFTFLASAALVGLVNSQAGSLPQCAQSCVDPFFASNNFGGCGTNAKCICENNTFLDDVACCLAKPGGCASAEQAQAVTYASQICAAVGVTVPGAVTCKTASAGSSTTSGAANATPTPTGVGAGNGTVNGDATPTTTRPSGAGARQTGLGMGIVGGVVAAVLL